MSSVQCTGTGTWRVADDWFNPPVRIPVLDLHRTTCCPATSPGGWLCTRPVHHGGRHAAACSNGDVMEVWL